MTAEATLAVHGTPPTSTDIQLCQGWNLIGYPIQESLPVAEALASIAGKYTLVFAWDATDVADPWEIYSVNRPAWANELQVMDPGRGYWVYVTEDVTLTIAEPAPTPTPTPAPVGRPPTAEITSLSRSKFQAPSGPQSAFWPLDCGPARANLDLLSLEKGTEVRQSMPTMRWATGSPRR